MMKNITSFFFVVAAFFVVNLTSCSKSDSPDTSTPTPTCSGTPGPLFTAVKTLMTARCVNCHNGNIANGGMNFSVDCNIVSAKARIKVRAVDEGTMPPTGALSQTDKNTINAWVTAGGRLTD